MAQKANDKKNKIIKKDETNVVKKRKSIASSKTTINTSPSLKSSTTSKEKKDNILGSILDNIESVKPTAKKVAKSVKKATKNAQKTIINKIDGTKPIVEKALKSTKKVVDKTISEAKPVFKKDAKEAKEIIDKQIENVKPIAQEVAKKTKKTVDKKIDEAKPIINKNVKKAKKVINKKIDKVKPVVKKATKKATRTVKKVSTKISKSTKKIVTKLEEKLKPIILEYYDLPYKYGKTVVTVLAQNPTTLFVYWEISDEDRKEFESKYGERFFYITKPVLVITNLTDDYSYEIDINDFANNWYIHVNDAKCKYKVELGRRKIEMTNDIKEEYIPITHSNVIEAPNDHVLFFKDGDKIYFKNIKNNNITERIYKNKVNGKNVKAIYSNYNLSDEGENETKSKFDFNNPSSQNPTSNVM